jgi:hypothetical protein
MEDKKYNFTVTGEHSEANPLVIVVREGTAPDIKEKQKLRLSVAIASIADFLGKKTVPTPVQDNPGVILFSVDPKGPFLEYLENPNDEDATVLTARLQFNKDLAAFGINDDQKFNHASLAKLVRKYAHCFASLEVAKDLTQRLQNFEVKFETVIAREDNRQGNTKDLVDSALKLTKGELPKEIHLKCPIYENTEPVDLSLEIEIDRGGDNKPLFSFYSLDFEIKKREAINSAIKTQVDRLKDAFAVVEQ